MKDMGIRQGSAKWAVPVTINHDTVYVHTDIKRIGESLYEYHEIQYGVEEYIELIGSENTMLKAQLVETQNLMDTLLGVDENG